MVYGQQVKRSVYGPPRGVIGAIETSGKGNVLLRVGRQHDAPHVSVQDTPHGWSQTEHVVLTRREATELVMDIMAALITNDETVG